MPGVPGAGGPPPKRSSQRRRTNTPAAGEPQHAPGAAEVVVPKPNSRWHPIAKRWFLSLAASGQAQFYEPSDWAAAELLAESMSRDLRPQVVGITDSGKVVKEAIPLKGASLAAYLKAFAALLVTEGDRRRVRLELERPAPEGEGEGDGNVTYLDRFREGLGN